MLVREALSGGRATGGGAVAVRLMGTSVMDVRSLDCTDSEDESFGLDVCDPVKLGKGFGLRGRMNYSSCEWRCCFSGCASQDHSQEAVRVIFARPEHDHWRA